MIRDMELAVTPAGQVGKCDNPLAFTDWTSVEARESAEKHTCTCQFPDGKQAVVHVIGANSQAQARGAVRFLWSPCIYRVLEGDVTRGHAAPFWLILSEPQPVEANRYTTLQCNGSQEPQGAREEACGPGYFHQ